MPTPSSVLPPLPPTSRAPRRSPRQHPRFSMTPPNIPGARASAATSPPRKDLPAIRKLPRLQISQNRNFRHSAYPRGKAFVGQASRPAADLPVRPALGRSPARHPKRRKILNHVPRSTRRQPGERNRSHPAQNHNLILAEGLIDLYRRKHSAWTRLPPLPGPGRAPLPPRRR